MIALSFIALAVGIELPPDRLGIARQVAGNGRPDCISYEVDGTADPCLPIFEAVPGGRINGWQSGGRISFSQAAVRRMSRDEFALLAGHEIAHFYLDHKGPSNRANELAADRLGARLACQAGFDPIAGASLFDHLRVGTTHPSRAKRRAAVIAVPCERI